MVRKNLGPYQLVRRLGAGGMAEVHLAISHGASGFQREVAIKTLAPELVGDADRERALIHEATLAGRLHHRNLVAVHGLGVDDGLYYVVMEYVDGGDLSDTVVPEGLALHIGCEVALGLAHLHAARDERGLLLGLVHRDLSPANILVSTTGDVKLADFGIAKATARTELTKAGARKGTYAYMAPEQLAGDPITAAADQWGLAVTLAELITGTRVFSGATPLETMQAIEHGTKQLTGLAPDVLAIVDTATAHAPGDRFDSIDALRRALEAVRRAREPAGTSELAVYSKVIPRRRA